MDSDQGKLFIGGISWETTEEKLKDYFGAFGEVSEAVIMKDRATGRARGFGFVVFADPSVADMVVLEKHNIDGRMVEAKKAVPREEQQNVNRNNNGGSIMMPSNQARTKKIFVGGLASSVTESDFRKYFGQFGTITDVVVMYDHGTQRPRGFGFITYDSEDAVDRVLQKTFHELNDKMVEVKRAVPKEASSGPIRNSGMGVAGINRGGTYGGGYPHAFNASPVSSHGMRMDRYSPSPNSRGSYSPYGSIGYGNVGNYGGSVNGTFNSAAAYGNAGFYRGGGYGNSNSGNAPYGSVGSALSNSAASIGYNSPSGRNLWGSGGSSYGSIGSSAGLGGNGGYNLNNHSGMNSWGSSQAPGSNNSSYGSQYSSYGSRDDTFTSSNSPNRYMGQNSGYSNSIGSIGSNRWGSGSSTLFGGDIYSSSVYSDPTWRATPADALNSGRVGSGGQQNGIFGLDSSTNGEDEHILTGDGGYGVSGRQSYRGVPV